MAKEQKEQGEVLTGKETVNITVTVNKQFASGDTALHAWDKVGIIPIQPW